MDIKDVILNNLTMINILDKYNIKHSRNMFHCPFHGKDRNPSAKAYKNSYYCFSCNSTSDLIGFVQKLFNLNFQQAMKKINDDFQLGLSTKSTYNKEQILKLEKEKKIKEYKEHLQKEKENIFFSHICKTRKIYEDMIKLYKRQINIENWEDIQLAINYCRVKLRKIDEYIYDKYGII